MQSSNIFLNQIWPQSSIYSQDAGQVNGNLAIILGAYATMLQDIYNEITQTSNNTYIASSDLSQLENNFGVLINFPYPPRLNTIANGQSIYQALLQALYQTYMLAPTAFSIQQAVSIILSYLILDPTTSPYTQETDLAFLTIPSKSVQLCNNAVHISGGSITGPALPSDISIIPPDFSIVGYNDSIKTIYLNGTPSIAQQYQITYNRTSTGFSGTNYINLTNLSGTNVLPLNLTSGVNTYANTSFSYWNQTYNRNGSGVSVINDLLNNGDQGIVWRLPERTVTYINPYNTYGNIPQPASIDLYDTQGNISNIDIVTPTNPDSIISSVPYNYFSEVSSNTANYYIRYSQNNLLSTPLAPFSGSFSNFQLNNYSLTLSGVNYSTLDFFESGTNFNTTDLFGYGTKHVWLNVPWANGVYQLNNNNYFDRPISFHEYTLWQDIFEQGNLNNWNISPSGYAVIGENLYNPNAIQQDCIKLFATQSGISTTATAILNNNVLVSGNHVSINFLDIGNSGTNTHFDVIRSSGVNYNAFRFGVDYNISGTQQPYYYQLSNSPINNSTPKNYLTTIPRSNGWHNIVYDFGTGINGLPLYSGINITLDGGYNFINQTNIGFAAGLESITLFHKTNLPTTEFSYFDNVRISYYDYNNTLPRYLVTENLENDWVGSALDQSTVLEARMFSEEPIPNFNFLVSVLGWTPDIVFVIQKIVAALKPAYANASIIFETQQTLDTISGSATYNINSDWNSGYTGANISVLASGSFMNLDETESLQGYITVSGAGISNLG